MRFLPLLLFFFSIFGAGVDVAHAKRVQPPEVKPVVFGGVQFSYEIEKLNIDCPEPADQGCGDRIFVVAKKMEKKKVGEEKWKTEVYRAVFDRKMETDVQAILPKSLRVKKANIELTDEHGSKYLVSRASGKLVKPGEVKVYSGP